MNKQLIASAPNRFDCDFIIIADASGSMRGPYQGNQSRWDAQSESLDHILSVTTDADEDGISVILMHNSIAEVTDNVNASNYHGHFDAITPSGTTPMHLAFAEMAKRINPDKSTICFVFTDGSPDNQMKTKTEVETIINGSEKRNVKIVFCQVGDDAGATEFLKHLDDDLETNYDGVDTKPLSYFLGSLGDVETLIQECWED